MGHFHIDLAACEKKLAEPYQHISFSESDYEVVSKILNKGSSSFWAASLLLPKDVRKTTVQIYAFCRIADDMVDESGEPERAINILTERLDRVYVGRPIDDPIDRSLFDAVMRVGLPRNILGALLEGFLWDANKKQYKTISDTLAYCARVAATIGVLMTVTMGVVDQETLARACDLGVVFQLVNISRDVGEDARKGRCYIPSEWLEAEGVNVQAWLSNPHPCSAISKCTERLLSVADNIALNADEGIARLPWNCQMAIASARRIYCDIGRIVRQDYERSFTVRSRTSTLRKLWLVASSPSTILGSNLVKYTASGQSYPVLRECRFLIRDFPVARSDEADVKPTSQAQPRKGGGILTHAFGSADSKNDPTTGVIMDGLKLYLVLRISLETIIMLLGDSIYAQACMQVAILFTVVFAQLRLAPTLLKRKHYSEHRVYRVNRTDDSLSIGAE
eukprot:Clim_evm6s198 gene=Clim_evmTU6s198